MCLHPWSNLKKGIDKRIEQKWFTQGTRYC